MQCGIVSQSQILSEPDNSGDGVTHARDECINSAAGRLSSLTGPGVPVSRPGGLVNRGPMGQVQDQFWGDRSGTFTDPHGFIWTIATRKEDLTPQEVQQRQDEFMKNFAAQGAKS